MLDIRITEKALLRRRAVLVWGRSLHPACISHSPGLWVSAVGPAGPGLRYLHPFLLNINLPKCAHPLNPAKQVMFLPPPPGHRSRGLSFPLPALTCPKGLLSSSPSSYLLWPTGKEIIRPARCLDQIHGQEGRG